MPFPTALRSPPSRLSSPQRITTHFGEPDAPEQAPGKKGLRSRAYLVRSDSGARPSVALSKLPVLESVPRYTTWITALDNTTMKARSPATTNHSKPAPSAPPRPPLSPLSSSPFALSLSLSLPQDEMPRKIFYVADGQLVPGSDHDIDDSDALERQQQQQLSGGGDVREDSDWSRYEDFLLVASAAEHGITPARRLSAMQPPPAHHGRYAFSPFHLLFNHLSCC